MSRKRRKKRHPDRRAEQAEQPPVRAEEGRVAGTQRVWFWTPTLLAVAWCLIEVGFILAAGDDFTRIFWIRHNALAVVMFASWGFAGLLAVWPRLREGLYSHLESLDLQQGWALVLWPAAAALAMSVLLFTIKMQQYRGLQLPQDTAILVNQAANLIKGGGFASTIDGMPTSLGVHFAFLVPLFAPVLFLWKSTVPFLFLQMIALGSMGLAVFLAGRRLSGSAAVGATLMGLLYTHSSFWQLVSSSLENSVFAPPLLLWSFAAFTHARLRTAAALFALCFATREAFPFTVAGLGLFWAFRDGLPDLRRGAEGVAIVIASALIWWAEVAFISSHPVVTNDGYWAWYSHLGSDKNEVIRFVLGHPLQTLWKVIHPLGRLEPFWQLFLHAGLAPLASPASVLIVLASAAPQLLASEYSFEIQYASYTFGPLFIASAYGLAKLHAKLPAKFRAWYAVLAFAVAGHGLRQSPRTMQDEWRGDSWREAAVELVPKIPEDASLWVFEYLTSWTAARRQIKAIDERYVNEPFKRMLFRPEYILAKKSWLALLEADARSKVIGFLASEKYEKSADSGSFILFKDPQAPRKGLSPSVDYDALPLRSELTAGYLGEVFGGPPEERTGVPRDLWIEPQNADEFVLLGLALMKRGKIKLAARAYRKAVELAPKNASARNNLGNVLLSGGRADQAVEHLELAYRLDPSKPIIRYNLGNAYLVLGKTEEAIKHLEAAVAGLPVDGGVFNNLGAAYADRGRFREAAAAFQRAVEIEPDMANARENLIRVREKIQAQAE